MASPFDESAFRQELADELTANILPFWMAHRVDRVHGGFYGAVTNDLEIRNDVPRSAILCARILWTYAAASHRLGAQPYLDMARWCYLKSHLVDREHGDWRKQLSREGTVDGSVYKAGRRECPYHHSRACFELLRRLAGDADEIRPL